MTFAQGVILSGGQSRRMGQNKALLKLNNEYFANHILKTLYSVCDKVMIIGPKLDLDKYTPNFHDDLLPHKGPAGGIYSAMKWAMKEALLVVSCDVPLIKESLVAELLGTYCDEDALICRYKDRVHPLIGIYNTRTVDVFRAAIESDNLKLMSIIQQMNSTFYEVPDEWAYQITNVNTKEDFNKIKHEYSN